MRVGRPGAVAVGGSVAVSGSDHVGKDKFVVTILGPEEFGVAQRHLDIVAGEDMAHAHAKHIGPFLFEEGGGLVLGLGLLVFRLRRFPFSDLRGDATFADGELETVHRGTRRSGKDINGLEHFSSGVAILLPHLDLGDAPGDAGDDLGVLQGQRFRSALFTSAEDDEIGGLRGVRLVVGMRSFGEEGERQEETEEGENSFHASRFAGAGEGRLKAL